MRRTKVGLQLQELRHRLARFDGTSGTDTIHDQCSERMSIGGEVNRFDRRRTTLLVPAEMKKRERTAVPGTYSQGVEGT